MALVGSVWYFLLALLGLTIRPDSGPTDELGQSSCSGLQVTDGSVQCSSDGDQTVCRVECDGQFQGEFTCTEGEGWIPELPTCVEPIDDAPSAEQVAPGCNLAKCHKHCQTLGKKGYCHGKRYCQCI